MEIINISDYRQLLCDLGIVFFFYMLTSSLESITTRSFRDEYTGSGKLADFFYLSLYILIATQATTGDRTDLLPSSPPTHHSCHRALDTVSTYMISFNIVYVACQVGN
jgi:hypothetical protein